MTAASSRCLLWSHWEFKKKACSKCSDTKNKWQFTPGRGSAGKSTLAQDHQQKQKTWLLDNSSCRNLTGIRCQCLLNSASSFLIQNSLCALWSVHTWWFVGFGHLLWKFHNLMICWLWTSSAWHANDSLILISCAIVPQHDELLAMDTFGFTSKWFSGTHLVWKSQPDDIAVWYSGAPTTCAHFGLCFCH